MATSLTENEVSLQRACREGNVQKVKKLLKAKTNIDCQDAEGRTPLYLASWENKVEIMKLLIAAGAKINLAKKDGATPLRVAAEKNCVDAMKLLLSARANVDLAMNDGTTPLYVAAEKNFVDVMKLLVSAGANVNLARNDGFTALRVASAHGSKDAVQVLIEAGANVDQAGEDGVTPLYVAAEKNFAEVVELLLSAGANVDLARDYGMTPLATASYRGNTSMVQLLLKAEAKTDIQDKDGDTALHNACTNGHDDAVEALISAYANMSLQNKDGRRPLDIAISKGHRKIIDMLQTAMLNPPQKPAKPLQISTHKEGATGRDMPRSQQAPPPLPPDKVSQSPTDVRSQSQVTESTGPSAESGMKQIPLTDLQLGKLLGSGTFGAVYQATWKSKQGKRVAVKKIIYIPGPDTKMPADITTLQSLPQHPHIIRYYGVAQSEDAVYIITEFAPNGSLYDHLYQNKEKPTFEQSRDWAWQIAHGMEHLHEHNIIHRDLKSANILLCIGNVAKIADFGTARYLDHTTEQSDVKGTYRWMAPEVIEEVEAHINKYCDAYSYGMVVYELFEHKVPFHEIPSKLRTGNAVLAGDRPTITCNLPPYLKNLIHACWKANSHERPTFTAIVIAFENKMFK